MGEPATVDLELQGLRAQARGLVEEKVTATWQYAEIKDLKITKKQIEKNVKTWVLNRVSFKGPRLDIYRMTKIQCLTVINKLETAKDDVLGLWTRTS